MMSQHRSSSAASQRIRLARQAAHDPVSIAELGTETVLVTTCCDRLRLIAADQDGTVSDGIRLLMKAMESESLGLSMAESQLARIGLCLLQSTAEATLSDDSQNRPAT